MNGNKEEWKKEENALLTDEISKATFGITTKQHKQVKGLEPKFKNQNLRDHMTDFELIFNMLGEASTTAIAKKDDARGFKENKESAKKGGRIAGNAREELEKELDQPVVSTDNYLELQEKKNLEHKKKNS